LTITPAKVPPGGVAAATWGSRTMVPWAGTDPVVPPRPERVSRMRRGARLTRRAPVLE
jgi:hypothetical protein